MAGLISSWSNRLAGAWDQAASRLQPGALILLYHRVARPAQDPLELAVSPENFADQLDHIQSRYHLCQVEEFTHHLLNKKAFPRHCVLLSFDDGYADNYLEALPILESAGHQALFYITTSLLGSGRELWWDELERILLGQGPLPPVLDLGTGISRSSWSFTDPSDRLRAFWQIQGILQYSTPESIGETMEAIRNWAGQGPEGRASHRLMDLSELKRMSGSQAAVLGCHTHHHPALGMLDPAAQRVEITESRQIIAEISGQPVRHFSYPFGSRKFWGRKRCYTRETIAICRELGFDMVAANFAGLVHTWSNPMALPRHPVRNWEKAEFTERIRKMFHE